MRDSMGNTIKVGDRLLYSEKYSQLLRTGFCTGFTSNGKVKIKGITGENKCRKPEDTRKLESL